MKYKIPLAKFFEYTGIEYEEDFPSSSSVYHDYENHSIEDILYNLPKKFKFTEEQLEKDEVLKEALNQALNDASSDGLIDACYKEQNEMVERFAYKMVEYINQIDEETHESRKKAINAIIINWQKDEVIIDVNVKTALSTTCEIINGEGMFGYTPNELATVWNGKHNESQAIDHHLHYLLNVKLIDEIWGLVGMPNTEWEVNSWDINEEVFTERIEDSLTTEQLSLSAQTLLAINTSKELKTTKERVVELEGELEKAIELLPKRELDAFIKATA